MVDNPTPNGLKILIINPDGSVKQLNTDSSGNLMVAVNGWNTLALTSPPAGTVVASIAFTFNADNTPNILTFKNAAGTTLFTLTFAYNAGVLQTITRT